MGVTASVYLAKDTVTGEMVAIKQIIRGLKVGGNFCVPCAGFMTGNSCVCFVCSVLSPI